MMAIGFLVGGFVTERELTRKGLPGQLGSSIVFWGAVGGIAGSRVWLWVVDWQAFLRDPLGMIFSGSGFVWYGGLIGGTASVSWLLYREKVPWLKAVDCIAPALAIGHAIGRIGCQLAGDGDWGSVSDLPWAMAYPHAIIGWDYPPGVRVHPTPIYELILYSGVFAFLWSIRARKQPDGTVFWWYLVLSGAARFAVEFVRINPASLFGLSHAQWFSLIIIALGAWRLWADAATAPAGPQPAPRPVGR